ncbi:protein kinase [Nocardia sp. NPDC057663]|uniref:serine/threonine-protein kinase n=1 Tax=Nocardia sp. NPDC057663 TaxID=3346201 RepID=UPI00366CB79C
MLDIGEVFAGFTVERMLGQGGMGTVYLARHPRLDRLTALKLLNRDLFADERIRARFEREADLAAGLDHPGIVTVFDRGTEGEQLWISMQYVDGIDAATVDPMTLPPERAVQIIEGVADALDYAHGRGVLHRDVKPANILLARSSGGQGERVFLTDFGIARLRADSTHLTQQGMFTATLAYASPEQMTGAELDHRSDQYSLACALYWLFTGVAPFDSPDPNEIIRGTLYLNPPPLALRRQGLPPALDAVLAAAMAKHPGSRFDSCAAFAKAARKALTSNTPPALPHPAAYYPPAQQPVPAAFPHPAQPPAMPASGYAGNPAPPIQPVPQGNWHPAQPPPAPAAPVAAQHAPAAPPFAPQPAPPAQPGPHPPHGQQSPMGLQPSAQPQLSPQSGAPAPASRQPHVEAATQQPPGAQQAMGQQPAAVAQADAQRPAVDADSRSGSGAGGDVVSGSGSPEPRAQPAFGSVARNPAGDTDTAHRPGGGTEVSDSAATDVVPFAESGRLDAANASASTDVTPIAAPSGPDDSGRSSSAAADSGLGGPVPSSGSPGAAGGFTEAVGGPGAGSGSSTGGVASGGGAVGAPDSADKPFEMGGVEVPATASPGSASGAAQGPVPAGAPVRGGHAPESAMPGAVAGPGIPPNPGAVPAGPPMGPQGMGRGPWVGPRRPVPRRMSRLHRLGWVLLVALIGALVALLVALLVVVLPDGDDDDRAADGAPPVPSSSVTAVGDSFAASRRVFPTLVPQGTAAEGPGYRGARCAAVRGVSELEWKVPALQWNPIIAGWQCERTDNHAGSVSYLVLEYPTAAQARSVVEAMPAAVKYPGDKDGVPFSLRRWVVPDPASIRMHTAHQVISFPGDPTRANYLIAVSRRGSSGAGGAPRPSAQDEVIAWWEEVPL